VGTGEHKFTKGVLRGSPLTTHDAYVAMPAADIEPPNLVQPVQILSISRIACSTSDDSELPFALIAVTTTIESTAAIIP
jgi:hypothetical protein